MKEVFTTKRPYKIRIFLGLLLLMIVVLLLVSVVNYVSSKSMLEQNAIDTNMATVRMLKNSIERTISDVQDSLVKVVSDNSAIYFMTMYHNSAEYIVEILEALDRLNAKVVYNKFYSGCYILYETDDVIVDISQGRILRRGEMTSLGNDGKYLENNAQIIDQVVARLNAEPGTDDVGMRIFNLDTSHKSNVLTFVKPIRMGEPGTRILLFITIDQEYFDNMLDYVKSNDAAQVMIVDSNDTPITRNPVSFAGDIQAFSPNNRLAFQTEDEGNFLAMVDGVRCLVTFVRSPAYGWRFVYAEPSAAVFSTVGRMLWQIAILFMVGAISVIMVAFVFTGHMYMPIKALVEEINLRAPDAPDTESCEIDRIRSGISMLALQKERMAATLERNRPVLKNAALNNLLSDKLTEEPWSIIDYYHANISRNALYAVFICSMDRQDGQKQPGVREMTQQEAAVAAFAGQPQVWLESVQRNTDGTVFIVSLLTQDAAQARQWLRDGVQAVQTEVRKRIESPMTIGVGGVCHSIGHLHRSYGEAFGALAHRAILGDGRVILFDELPHPQQWYYIYPFEVEKRLFSLVKAGDMPGVSNALMDYIRYIIDHDISPQDDRYVFIHLLDNTIKCCVELSLDVRDVLNEHDNLYRELLDITDITHVRRWFEDIFTQITQYIQIKRDTRSEDTARCIRDFIDEHYASPDISMAALSEELHYSESHLSKVFRITYNDTVKQYITKRRMEHACELLQNADLKIKDIAEAVGYPNTQAFLKIFKKIYGETPSGYQAHWYHAGKG